MKSKAPLPFMEQVIMILVFAITAALCLKGFAAANTLSLQQERKNAAVILAQNAAETLKATGGDYEALANVDRDDDALTLKATPKDTDNPFLGAADIKVFYEEELLLQISAAWQEVN